MNDYVYWHVRWESLATEGKQKEKEGYEPDIIETIFGVKYVKYKKKQYKYEVKYEATMDNNAWFEVHPSFITCFAGADLSKYNSYNNIFEFIRKMYTGTINVRLRVVETK